MSTYYVVTVNRFKKNILQLPSVISLPGSVEAFHLLHCPFRLLILGQLRPLKDQNERTPSQIHPSQSGRAYHGDHNPHTFDRFCTFHLLVDRVASIDFHVTASDKLGAISGQPNNQIIQFLHLPQSLHRRSILPDFLLLIQGWRLV